MKKVTALLHSLLFVFISNYTIAQVNDSLQLLIPVSHKYAISSLAWSDNNRHFATGSGDGYIKIWDARSASITHTLSGHAGQSMGNGVGALCFTPNGKYLLSAELTINIWDVTSGQRVGKLDTFNVTYIYSIDVSPNSKIALNASGSTANLWDINSGRLIREYTHPGFVQCVKFSKDGTHFLTGCADGSIRLYDSTSEEIIKEFKFTNNEIIAVDFSVDESKIIFAAKNTIYICDKNTGSIIKSFEGQARRDRSLVFTPDDNSILVAEYNKVRKIDIKNGNSTVVFPHDDFNEVTYSKDKKRALYSIKGEGENSFYGPINTGIIDLGSGKTVKEFKNRFTAINKVKFSPDNRSLAAITGNHQIRIIDLSNITNLKIINSYFARALSISPNGNLLAYGHGTTGKYFVSVVDYNSLKNIELFKVTDGVSSIAFSGDNKLMAVGLTSGKVLIIDLDTRSIIYTFNAITDYIVRLHFSIENNYLLVATARSIELRNINRKEREWYFPLDMPLDRQKFPKVNLERWTPDVRVLLDLFKKNYRLWDEQISIDGKTVLFSRDQAYIVKRDAQSGALIKKYEGHQGNILSVAVSNNNKLVASSADDNILRVWDNTSGKTLVSYFAIDSSDWFWITPANYYGSSKNASKVVSFRKNNQIYRFHQFDLLLNRPDLVMKNIGLSSDSAILFYTQLIEKRIRKMGIKTDAVPSGLSVPVINIINLDSIPDFTEQPAILLNVKATDPHEDLNKINVWVNGVPVYSASLEKKGAVSGKTFQTRFNIPLTEGRNVIEVSCSNKSGRESLIESVLVNYDPAEKRKPNLYIVAMGVSEYEKYPGSNLKYAAKDAEDLVKAFRTSTLFDSVHAYTLTNRYASRDSILKIKEELMKSEVDDYVILSFSGHGIVNNNLDFYFCTNGIDLDRIDSTAVSFKEMENLLDGIPPYKKMLLIDACYSGEVDKETARAIIKNTDSTKALYIGDAKPFTPGNVLKSNDQSTFELIKESFVDLRRRTGTVVISSSSGVDLSYEKDKWKNGLFTYAVLSALSNTGDVDLNSDGIYVSEFIPYLISLVKNLSKGLQVPTMREENIEFDYRIW
jgi:WD40 repeat protein